MRVQVPPRALILTREFESQPFGVLRSFIQAAGGELQLIATFPDSTPVHLLVGESDALEGE